VAQEAPGVAAPDADSRSEAPADPPRTPAEGEGAKAAQEIDPSAHKAPSRKPAARARRPAKPKTPEGA
jgi:hypothetical protein